MTDSTMVESGVGILKQISIVDPILALLLLVLLSIVIFLYRKLDNKEKDIKELQKSKEDEVKELNKILLNVREQDKEMLTELKNLITKFIETEKEQVSASKEASDKMTRNGEYLLQILAKTGNFITS